jgi:hypothetical protein
MKVLVGLLVLVCSVSAASAAPITVNFTAEILAKDGDGNIRYSGVSSVNGTIVLDDAAADINGAPDIGHYDVTGAPYGGVLNVGGDLFTFTRAALAVVNGALRDELLFDVLELTPGILTDGQFALYLSSADLSTLSSEAFVSAVPPLANFAAGNEFFFNYAASGPVLGEISGRVTSLSVENITPVPEPATLLLVGVGLTGTVLKRRRPRS